MKSSNSFFFGYCAFASLFLLVSAIMTFQKSGNVLVLIVLFPIIGYFVYYFARLLIKKEPLPSGPKSKTVNKIILIVFVALVTGSTYTILAIPSEKATMKKSQWIATTPDTHMKKQQFGTIKTDGDGRVRVRQKPSVESAIVDTAKNGQTFEILENADDWVRVSLEASQSGWIHTEFITVSDSK